jgi:hypothetical protein
MACDTGLVVPEPLRQAGFDNSSFQALPPLEQTLTPALFLFHLEAVSLHNPTCAYELFRCFEEGWMYYVV